MSKVSLKTQQKKAARFANVKPEKVGSKPFPHRKVGRAIGRAERKEKASSGILTTRGKEHKGMIKSIKSSLKKGGRNRIIAHFSSK